MSEAVIHPKFHHFNLKTTRLQELIDWYSLVVGADVLLPGRRRRVAVQRCGQPPHRAARVPRVRRRPREGHPHRAAPQRVRVRQLRGPQRQLPAPARGRDRARLLPRPRDDALLLLQGPRRQLRRAAGRQLRRLGQVQPVHAHQRGLPPEPDRRVRRPRPGRPGRRRRRSLRAHPRARDGRRVRARPPRPSTSPPKADPVRLVTYDAGDGAHAGVLVGDEIVPAAALGAPARLREGPARGPRRRGPRRPRRAGRREHRAHRALRRAAPGPGPGPREDHLPGPQLPRPRRGGRARRSPSTRAGSRSSPTR